MRGVNSRSCLAASCCRLACRFWQCNGFGSSSSLLRPPLSSLFPSLLPSPLIHSLFSPSRIVSLAKVPTLSWLSCSRLPSCSLTFNCLMSQALVGSGENAKSFGLRSLERTSRSYPLSQAGLAPSTRHSVFPIPSSKVRPAISVLLRGAESLSCLTPLTSSRNAKFRQAGCAQGHYLYDRAQTH